MKRSLALIMVLMLPTELLARTIKIPSGTPIYGELEDTVSSKKKETSVGDTARRSGELVRGVFEVLQGSPEGLQARDVLAKLAERVPPTDFELSTYPSNPNVRRYEKIVRFATIGPVKAGWLVKEKGTWLLTGNSVTVTSFREPHFGLRSAV